MILAATRVYAADVNVRLLPRQSVRVSIDPDSSARIRLEGAVDLEEELVLTDDGRYTPGPLLRRLLHKYRCKLGTTWVNDSHAYTSLRFPVVGAVGISMTRV